MGRLVNISQWQIKEKLFGWIRKFLLKCSLFYSNRSNTPASRRRSITGASVCSPRLFTPQEPYPKAGRDSGVAICYLFFIHFFILLFHSSIFLIFVRCTRCIFSFIWRLVAVTGAILVQFCIFLYFCLLLPLILILFLSFSLFYCLFLPFSVFFVSFILSFLVFFILFFPLF